MIIYQVLWLHGIEKSKVCLYSSRINPNYVGIRAIQSGSAQANITFNKPGFSKKSVDHNSAILVGVNSARNSSVRNTLLCTRSRRSRRRGMSEANRERLLPIPSRGRAGARGLPGAASIRRARSACAASGCFCSYI